MVIFSGEGIAADSVAAGDRSILQGSGGIGDEAGLAWRRQVVGKT